MQKIIAHVIAGGISFFFFSAVAYAQSNYVNPINITAGNGTKISTIPCLLVAIVDFVFLIGVPIVVIFIIFAGFLFVTAGDNENQLAKARFTFFWTMIGALVLLGAKAIAKAIDSTVLSLGTMSSTSSGCL